MNPFAVSGRWRATTSPATSDPRSVLEPGSASLHDPGGSAPRSSESGWPLAANPRTVLFGEQPLGRLEAAEAESLVRMMTRELELPPSARVHAVRRFRRKPQPTLPEELAPGGPKPFASSYHTRCSIAVRLSLGGARRTKSPMLTYRPRCSRSSQQPWLFLRSNRG